MNAHEERQSKDLVNLLLVDISVADVVVECPLNEADLGDLVEFAYDDRDVIGTVIKQIYCWKDCEEYAFISDLTTIYQARTIWRNKWRASDRTEEENLENSDSQTFGRITAAN